MFASCYGRGLTHQLVEQSLCFTRLVGSQFTAVADHREQFPGLYERLDSGGVQNKKIAGLDDHKGFGKLLREFCQVVEAAEPDVVITHTNWQFCIASTLRRWKQKPYKLVYVHHGYRHNSPLMSLVFRKLIGGMLSMGADLVIAPCQRVQEAFPGIREKTVVIPLGEDSDLFRPSTPISFGGQRHEFVFAGEFRRGKNQESLIRAFIKYAELSGRNEWVLHLPGSGPLLAECRNLASKGKFSENFSFPGMLNRKQLLSLYQKCQFAVIPTNFETFGHCIVEPFILGRAVISRPVGIAADLIRHGENGFLFDKICELPKLLSKVTADEKLCMEVGSVACSERDQFRWEQVCGKLLTLCQQLASSSVIR